MRRKNDQSTESQCVRIRVIDAWEALGYRGVGREEHSGETAPSEPADLDAELADNRRSQIVTGILSSDTALTKNVTGAPRSAARR